MAALGADEQHRAVERSLSHGHRLVGAHQQCVSPPRTYYILGVLVLVLRCCTRD